MRVVTLRTERVIVGSGIAKQVNLRSVVLRQPAESRTMGRSPMQTIELTALVVVIAVMAAIGGSIAKRRGIRVLEGCAWAIVLGPLGLIILCLLPAPTDRMPRAGEVDRAARIQRGKDAAARLALQSKLQRGKDHPSG